MLSVQDLIRALQNFWASKGCTLHSGYDVETGAGTFNPATFFRALGPEPYRAAYVELCRRPKDGRYGENPNRMQLFHQYQVILKPSPIDAQQLYLQSLQAIGFTLNEHDIRFVHDDWEQPSLGAWGLGWEVWRDGMEISQFTYFQAMAGMDLDPVTVELTYGIERIAMTLQNRDSVWDLMWDDRLTYGEIFQRNEVDWSKHNFDQADVSMWRRHLEDFRREARALFAEALPVPAYDFVMKASHAFNILDARGVISVTERTGVIADIRDLARQAAERYLQQREAAGYPLLKKNWPVSASTQAQPPTPTHSTLEGSADFVWEIGSEELPASFIPIGMQSLQQRLKTALDDLGVPYESIQVYGTPRRLTAYVTGLARARPARCVERRGPSQERAYDSTGSLTEVGEGFIRSLGPDSQVEIRDYKGAGYLFGKVVTPACSTARLLAETLPTLIETIDFPKRMRWGTSRLTYARPVHWILALHGAEPIVFDWNGVRSGSKSQAHPQICPGMFEVAQATEYLSRLREHHVLASVEERKNSILAQLAEIEQQTSLQVLQLNQLLGEVVCLVEWPLVTTASFSDRFLEAPAEILISEMVTHQRDFPLADSQGRLTPHFVITADNWPSDEIRRGNVKVLSARLSDGAFLYNQDLKVSLSQFNERLKLVTFRQELGSVYDKVQRIVANVEALYQLLPIGDLRTARRAAELCKADLASDLVQEFPNLQGTIGRYYALAQGESPAVAVAIEEHWMPIGEGAELPISEAGILVSLGDKIDNLVSAFSLGLRPSSSSDPYGLRRQVLGIVRTLVHSKLRLPLKSALDVCYQAFLKATGSKLQSHLVAELMDFFSHRIRTVFLDYGLTKEETASATGLGLADVYDSFCRVQALHRFRADPRFASLAEVYKRAKGQVVGYEGGTFSTQYLIEPQERELAQAIQDQQPRFESAMQEGNYDLAYQLLANLQPKLASLFDHVRILDENPQIRINRISLLDKVFSLFSRLLDFSSLRL